MPDGYGDVVPVDEEGGEGATPTIDEQLQRQYGRRAMARIAEQLPPGQQQQAFAQAFPQSEAVQSDFAPTANIPPQPETMGGTPREYVQPPSPPRIVNAGEGQTPGFYGGERLAGGMYAETATPEMQRAINAATRRGAAIDTREMQKLMTPQAQEALKREEAQQMFAGLNQGQPMTETQRQYANQLRSELGNLQRLYQEGHISADVALRMGQHFKDRLGPIAAQEAADRNMHQMQQQEALFRAAGMQAQADVMARRIIAEDAIHHTSYMPAPQPGQVAVHVDKDGKVQITEAAPADQTNIPDPRTGLTSQQQQDAIHATVAATQAAERVRKERGAIHSRIGQDIRSEERESHLRDANGNKPQPVPWAGDSEARTIEHDMRFAEEAHAADLMDDREYAHRTANLAQRALENYSRRSERNPPTDQKKHKEKMEDLLREQARTYDRLNRLTGTPATPAPAGSTTPRQAPAATPASPATPQAERHASVNLQTAQARISNWDVASAQEGNWLLSQARAILAAHGGKTEGMPKESLAVYNQINKRLEDLARKAKSEPGPGVGFSQ